MNWEIERKYRVTNRSYQAGATRCTYYKQGYLSTNPAATVRIRIAGDRAFITVKGSTTGCSRQEYEYPIPVTDATAMLDGLCQSGLIEKKRYLYPYAGHTWEIDEFMGNNEGLVVAEVELQSESEPVALPSFVGREVTGDSRYYNSNLAKLPYCDWCEKE